MSDGGRHTGVDWVPGSSLIVDGSISGAHVGGESHELKPNGVCRCWDDLKISADKLAPELRIESLELSALGVGTITAERLRIGAMRP